MVQSLFLISFTLGGMLARVALVLDPQMSYRTHSNYLTKFGRRPASDQEASAGLGPAPEFSVQSYLRHQGQKFLDRGFDANTYIK